MKLSGIKRQGKRSGASRESARASYAPYEKLDFRQIANQAEGLADLIERRFEELAHMLLEYESYEVVRDEVGRTLDLLRNLKENKAYFKQRIGEVTTFLPRNQPLYALACFVIVPSFMASKVHFRIPHSMRRFFPKLLALLEVYERFPNIAVSHKERSDFMTERTALRLDQKTGDTLPVTDAVIFTGISAHADQLRLVFDERTLFITNGSGHNPIVVAKDANLRKAVEATLTLALYNQGQDCAAPNAILVHKDIYQDFLRLIRDELRTVRVGHYSDKTCRVGPISDPKDLVRIQDILIRNRQWLDPTTPGIIRAHDAILEPTIIAKPLAEGGNFTEVFAPVIFLQRYEKDADLAAYFEDPAYAPNAMYVTLYGTSSYVRSLAGRRIAGKTLHDRSTMHRNTHLHAHGVERGTQPYGGYGYGASSVSIRGVITPKPTLPQRDIFEHVVRPLMNGKALKAAKEALARHTKVVEKDLHKLLRTKGAESVAKGGSASTDIYIDLHAFKQNGPRYALLAQEHAYHLLAAPNVKYIARMKPAGLELVRKLRALLAKRKLPSIDAFKTELYAIAKDPAANERKNKERQLAFFQDVYQLLLGEQSGPRLAQFLMDVDRKRVCELLDV